MICESWEGFEFPRLKSMLLLPFSLQFENSDVSFLQCLGFTDCILFHHALTDNYLSFQSCCSLLT